MACELAFLRASVLNGCAACVRRHAAAARQHGLTDPVIATLLTASAADHTALTEQERTVLRLTDTLTSSPGDLDRKLLNTAIEYLSEPQLAELVLIIAAASALNRLVMFSRHLSDHEATLGREA